MLASVFPLCRAIIRLTVAIAAWWLLIAGVLAGTIPGATDVGQLPPVLPGRIGHITTPSGDTWLIPVDRSTSYEVDRPAPDPDEDGTQDVRGRPDWLVVRDGQAVQVLDVDRAAVQLRSGRVPGGYRWRSRCSQPWPPMFGSSSSSTL